jgi:hypothetical protein
VSGSPTLVAIRECSKIIASKATAQIRELLALSEQAVLAVVLAHKLTGQLAGTAESFQFGVTEPELWSWADAHKQESDGIVRPE